MAIYDNDPFGLGDYSRYHDWEQVKAPTGEIYYVIPGHPGYVLDPVASRASGRAVFRRNPKLQIQEYEDAQQAKKDAKKQGSLGNQAVTMGAGIAGSTLAYQATTGTGLFGPGGDKSKGVGTQIPTTTQGQANINTSGIGQSAGQGGGVIMVDGKPSVTAAEAFYGDPNAQGVANTADVATFGDTSTGATTSASGRPLDGSGGNISPQGQAAAQGAIAPQAGELAVVDQVVMPDGSEGHLMSDGTKVSDTEMVTPEGETVKAGTGEYTAYIQGASAALNYYNAYNQYKEGDNVGAGLSAAAGTAQLGAAAGSSTAAEVAPYLNYAMTAYDTYKILNNDTMTKEEKAARSQQRIGLAVADAYTYGLTSPAVMGLLKSSKEARKFDKFMTELDIKTNPMNWAISAAIGGSKDKNQLMRDQWRKTGEKAGFLQKTERADGSGAMSHHIQLADGSLYDVGQDGKTKVNDRRPYEVDHESPIAGQVIGWVNPIAAITSGGTNRAIRDLQTSSAGYLTNAALSNAASIEDAKANALAFYKQMGLDQTRAIELLDDLKNEDKIREEEYNAYRAGIMQLFEGQPASTFPQAPQEEEPPQGIVPISQGQAAAQGAMQADPKDPNSIGARAPVSEGNNMINRSTQAQAAAQGAMGVNSQDYIPAMLIYGPDGKPLEGQALIDYWAEERKKPMQNGPFTTVGNNAQGNYAPTGWQAVGPADQEFNNPEAIARNPAGFGSTAGFEGVTFKPGVGLVDANGKPLVGNQMGINPTVASQYPSAGFYDAGFGNVSNQYGNDVAAQVQAANAAGRNVGVGGPGFRWDGKNFVRG